MPYADGTDKLRLQAPLTQDDYDISGGKYMKIALLMIISIIITFSCSNNYYNQRLIDATRKGNIDEIRSLSNTANYYIVDSSNNTLLHISVLNTNNEIINYLSTVITNVNDYNKEGKTALQLAVELGTLDTVTNIISLFKNVNINKKDKNGNSILFYIPTTGYLEYDENGDNTEKAEYIIRFLLNSGLNPDEFNIIISNISKKIDELENYAARSDLPGPGREAYFNKNMLGIYEQIIDEYNHQLINAKEKVINYFNNKDYQGSNRNYDNGDCFDLTNYIDTNDTRLLNIDPLQLIQNEIVARRGHVFKKLILNDIFSNTKWYQINPSYKPEIDLNSYEKYNIKYIDDIKNNNK